MPDATAEREMDAIVFARYDRLRNRNKWAGRIAFADRACAVNMQSVADPEGWIDGLLETERILG